MESMATPCHTSMPLFLSKYHLVICFPFLLGMFVQAKTRQNEASSRRRRGGVEARPVLQRVSTDTLMFHPGPPSPAFLHPVGGPPPKRPYGRFGGGMPTGRAVCGRLLPPWIPLAIQAWSRRRRGGVEAASGRIWQLPATVMTFAMGAWQGVAMDSLKFHPGPPCPTLLRPAGGPLLK
jgi:hypothetical protein